MTTSFRDPLIQRCALAVRRLREARGISQENFARQIGVNRSYQGKLEQGKTNPGLLYLGRIAEGLGISLEELGRAIDSTKVPKGAPAKRPMARAR